MKSRGRVLHFKFETANIKTLEGRDAVKDMLGACLNQAKPRNWALEESETVSETDGVTEAWFTFETEVGRGYGLMAMELNYWGSTLAKHASYDAANKEWAVTVERDGREIILRPKQLVFATGMAAKPNTPKFKGMESFKGEPRCNRADS